MDRIDAHFNGVAGGEVFKDHFFVLVEQAVHQVADIQFAVDEVCDDVSIVCLDGVARQARIELANDAFYGCAVWTLLSSGSNH